MSADVINSKIFCHLKDDLCVHALCMCIMLYLIS